MNLINLMIFVIILFNNNSKRCGKPKMLRKEPHSHKLFEVTHKKKKTFWPIFGYDVCY